MLATIPSLGKTGAPACPPEGTAGAWSREAIYLCPQYKGRDFTRDMSIQAPDGKTTLRVGNERWWLELEGRMIFLPRGESRVTEDDSRVTENAEFAWAPDGRTFYLTQSENRAGVQGYYTLVVRVVKGRIVRALDVNRIIQHEFNRHHECVAYDARGKRYSEESDIGAVKWVDSDQLLMVAETTYDSDCARGYFAGYLVSLSQQKVVRRYSAGELMPAWSDAIGKRLKAGFGSLTAEQKDAAP